MNARALLLLLCVCGWDAADNRIGEAGAVALAKALESGRSQLQSLNLFSESLCLATCAAGLCGIRSGCHALGRWCVRACGVEGVGWRLLLLTDCGCVAVLMCGWDASVNNIGEAGAVALAKALASGQCQLQSLSLGCESLCLAACAAGLCGIRSGCHALGQWCVRGCGLESVGDAC